MFKNVASQKIALFAFIPSTGLPKTGDAAQITMYVAKDYGSVTALTDTSATEMDATNAKGWYVCDVAQAESNADALVFTGKSSTSDVSLVGQLIYTTPPKFNTVVIDAAGLVDANVVKVGPTGSGTAQTAGDLKASITAILTTAMTESYSTDGSTRTAAQALYELMSFLFEANISSTTLTSKKIDGSTSAMTFTLSDATNPVTITRAT